QRRLFAADVTAWTDKQCNLKGEISPQDALSDPTVPLGADQFGADDFLLLLVFVANVKITALGACDQARQNHSLDHEVRHLREDEAVFDGPGLALIGVANDVLVQ